ncbi:YihY/virulence factor BrkB family protein [Euzebya rosea]|uniref:YihY/virulence factor BrkB family protein n=1 Tax=Euzebya rosea TaxID=2052804 RepID=UPI000D3E3199|nr:YihY/virulence factor BrkB family protein [Euzebya rosea]
MSRIQRLIGRLPPRVRGAVQVLVDTGKESADDRVTGLAAEIAFWMLLSLPPLLLTVVASAGFVGDVLGTDVEVQLITQMVDLAAQVFATDTVDATIRPTLESLLTEGSGSVVSLSFLTTLFSASRALRVVVHALTIAYDLEDTRPGWVSVLLGFGFTLVIFLGGLVVIPLVVAGPRMGEIIEDRLGVQFLLAETWRFLYWPVAILLGTALLAALYHWATPWRTPFHRELPGAVLAAVLGLLASLGLRTYTSFAFGGEAVYAPLAAPLAILLWVWLLAMSLLIGGELNAEIERAHPAGDPPPDVPTLGQMGRRAVTEVRRLRNNGTSDGQG